MATMTMKVFLTSVLATEGISEEVSAFATRELEKLAEKAEKRKTSEKALAKEKADGDLRLTMLDLMDETTAITAPEMAAKVTEFTGTEVTTAKVSAMFKKLVEAGFVTEGEGKSKGRKVKAYTKTESGEDFAAETEGLED